MILNVSCARHPESARTNNIMVLLKIAAILIFIFGAAHFIKPGNRHPDHPNRLVQRAHRRLDHLLQSHIRCF